VLGYNVSAQYVGQVAGPILAGAIGSTAGTSAVFLTTAGVTAAGLVTAAVIRRRFRAQLAA
jgi:dipeptide/tripeptide permease